MRRRHAIGVTPGNSIRRAIIGRQQAWRRGCNHEQWAGGEEHGIVTVRVGNAERLYVPIHYPQCSVASRHDSGVAKVLRDAAIRYHMLHQSCLSRVIRAALLRDETMCYEERQGVMR